MELKTLTSWKGLPISLGVLVAFILAGVAISSWTLRGEEKIIQISDMAVKAHVDKDITLSHPRLVDKFVDKRELNGALHKIDLRLNGIESNQQTILNRLPVR